MESKLSKEEQALEKWTDLKIFLENKIRALGRTVSPHFLVQQYNELMQHFYVVVLNEMKDRDGQPPMYQPPINPRFQINLDEVLEWIEQEESQQDLTDYMILDCVKKILAGNMRVKKTVVTKLELVKQGPNNEEYTQDG